MRRSEQVKTMIDVISLYLTEHGIDHKRDPYRIYFGGPIRSIYWECGHCLYKDNKTCGGCKKSDGSTRPLNSIRIGTSIESGQATVLTGYVSLGRSGRVRIQDWLDPKINPESALKRILKAIDFDRGRCGS